MKILYVAPVRLPTEKAHGVQIMKMCEAYAKQGHEVTLLVPKRKNSVAQDAFQYYGIDPLFEIRPVFSFDSVAWGRVGYWLHRVSFTLASLPTCFEKSWGLIHARDELCVFLISFFKKNCVFEAHNGKWDFLTRGVLSRSPVVVISKALRIFFLERTGLPSEVLVAPDAVDVVAFSTPQDTARVRSELSIAPETPLIVYTGHLYGWKGADTLARAMQNIPQAMCLIIGGTEEDIEKFKTEFGHLENVKILGRKPYAEIPVYAQAADVLVLPNSAKDTMSRLYTSPMKLFEYMASGTPIIASDIPSIREILDEGTATFAAPDDPHTLASAIKEVLAAPYAAQEKARAAKVRVEAFTWEKRAKRIVEWMRP